MHFRYYEITRYPRMYPFHIISALFATYVESDVCCFAENETSETWEKEISFAISANAR
jgi:hypothetical protein